MIALQEKRPTKRVSLSNELTLVVFRFNQEHLRFETISRHFSLNLVFPLTKQDFTS